MLPPNMGTSPTSLTDGTSIEVTYTWNPDTNIPTCVVVTTSIDLFGLSKTIADIELNDDCNPDCFLNSFSEALPLIT